MIKKLLFFLLLTTINSVCYGMMQTNTFDPESAMADLEMLSIITSPEELSADEFYAQLTSHVSYFDQVWNKLSQEQRGKALNYFNKVADFFIAMLPSYPVKVQIEQIISFNNRFPLQDDSIKYFLGKRLRVLRMYSALIALDDKPQNRISKEDRLAIAAFLQEKLKNFMENIINILNNREPGYKQEVRAQLEHLKKDVPDIYDLAFTYTKDFVEIYSNKPISEISKYLVKVDTTSGRFLFINKCLNEHGALRNFKKQHDEYIAGGKLSWLKKWDTQEDHSYQNFVEQILILQKENPFAYAEIKFAPPLYIATLVVQSNKDKDASRKWMSQWLTQSDQSHHNFCNAFEALKTESPGLHKYMKQNPPKKIASFVQGYKQEQIANQL